VVAPRALVRQMHGTHNGFVLLDERPPRARDYAALARRLCAADAGGFAVDGLLVVGDAAEPSAAASMRVFNADGSEAEMCGNGVRCVARFLFEGGAGQRFAIATAAGLIGVEVVAGTPEFRARIAMGVPEFPDAGVLHLEAAGSEWDLHRVTTGNPHAVAFVAGVDAIDLESLGAELNARREHFPEGTNVHVAQRIDGHTLRVRHFERGVGLTQACGTGAVACAAAALRAGLVTAPVLVQVPGGTLTIDWTGDGVATMTGPAEHVLEREIAL